jgi:hypothetical protein
MFWHLSCFGYLSEATVNSFSPPNISMRSGRHPGTLSQRQIVSGTLDTLNDAFDFGLYANQSLHPVN